jgi:WhiB family redox-sensing transcriptional regulator
MERRPDKRRREQRAKEICADCSVLNECRAYAIEIGEQHGIWGGLTEKERRALQPLST